MTSLTAFAAHTDGSTEVIACIETVPTDSVQPSDDSTNNIVSDDEMNISTGELLSVCIIIALIISFTAILVIFFFVKNDRHGNKDILK